MYEGGTILSTICVQGLQPLHGEITIQGSKNAILPIMAATLLHSGKSVIENVPRIQDVFCMIEILESLGCMVFFVKNRLEIDTTGLKQVCIPENQVKQMRSSVMLLGPMLGRLGEACSFYPGGCLIGKRPIDLHLYALRKLGAHIIETGDQLIATSKKLIGSSIYLSFPSVGATENAIMAAVKAEGITTIYGAAKEPEIMELCRFLIEMGADIQGIGSGILIIFGGKPLHDCRFHVASDRIVAGTYLGATLVAKGKVFLKEAPSFHMEGVLRYGRHVGAKLSLFPDGILVEVEERPNPVEVYTGPYPEFPTDLQSVMLAVATIAQGESHIEETVFENRFAVAKELQKMGADVKIRGNHASVKGKQNLEGTLTKAMDLRGGAALVVAALGADGISYIEEDYHIQRGYEDICRDLSAVGAKTQVLG